MFFPERGWKFSSVHVQSSASSLGLWGGLKSPCHHGTKKWRRFPDKNNAKGLCFTLLFQEIHCFFQQLALSDVFQSMIFGEFQVPEIEGPFNPAASMISSWNPFIFTAKFLQNIRSAPGNHHDLGICRLWRTSEWKFGLTDLGILSSDFAADVPWIWAIFCQIWANVFPMFFPNDVNNDVMIHVGV